MEIIQENDVTKASYDGHFIKIPTDQIRLLGQHNYFDIGIAYAVCSLLKIEDTVFINGLKSYQPLPHRLQPIRGKKTASNIMTTLFLLSVRLPFRR